MHTINYQENTEYLADILLHGEEIFGQTAVKVNNNLTVVLTNMGTIGAGRWDVAATAKDGNGNKIKEVDEDGDVVTIEREARIDGDVEKQTKQFRSLINAVRNAVKEAKTA